MTGAIALLASALAPPSQVPPEKLTLIFASACLDGELTLKRGEASEIAFDQLPSSLRARLGKPVWGRIFRLSETAPAYLYVLDYVSAPTTSPKVCGVASEDMHFGAAAEFLRNRVGGPEIEERMGSREWVLADDGYAAIATKAGKFKILQVRWLSAEQQRRTLKVLRYLDVPTRAGKRAETDQ